MTKRELPKDEDNKKNIKQTQNLVEKYAKQRKALKTVRVKREVKKNALVDEKQLKL